MKRLAFSGRGFSGGAVAWIGAGRCLFELYHSLLHTELEHAMPVVTKELTGKEKPEKYGDKERVWIVFLNPDAPIYCFSEPEIATAVARLREEEQEQLAQPKPKSRFDDDDGLSR